MTYQVHYTGKFYKGLTREMKSPSYSTKITYEVGKTYDADSFVVSDDDCGPGIHVVTSLAAALKWGPVVVEVEIPDEAEIVWSKDKLRTSRVTVTAVASLRGANLYGANLCGADLYRADLYGADLSGANLSGADLYGALHLDEALNYLLIVGEPATLPEGWRYDKGLIVPSPKDVR